MPNLFDYLSWRGDLSFSQSPFNPVDNIILSQLSYLPFNDIVPGHGHKEGISIALASKLFHEKMQQDENFRSNVMFKNDPALISALGSSRRFDSCHLSGYVNYIDTEKEVQFSAICVFTGDGQCTVIFRGTDFTLVGWKEDFNMSFNDVIPAQIEAVKYLEQIASMTTGPLRLCGHSKGGNLAVYAASHASKNIQKRIGEIYSNDAPGFHVSVIESEGFSAIKNRIRSFVPQSSVVGMFFEQGCGYKVIKSSKIGLMQHELYSWEVSHNDMIQVDEVTLVSRFVSKTLHDWLNTLPVEKRGQFIDAVYDTLSSSEAKSLPELEESWLNSTGRIFKFLSNMDKSKRRLMREAMIELIRSASHNVTAFLKPPEDAAPHRQ